MRREAFLLVWPLLVAACGGGDTVDATDPTLVVTEGEVAAVPATPAQDAPAMVIDTAAAAGDRPLMRESYAYGAGGRDPFRSVINVSVSGPEMPDLSLVGVIYDVSNPRQSLATFRENGSNRRYNVSPGQTIGRLFVADVTATSATLRMNDFGVVREQTYSLRTRENDAP